MSQDFQFSDWLNSHSWPPARAKWLERESTRKYRNAYMKYRKGHCKGAKGEIFHVCDEPPVAGLREASKIREISIFQEFEEDPHTIKVAQQLELYRRAYRQFRSGFSKGAEGELSIFANKISVEHLRLLPVAALARCLADQVKGAVVVQESKFHCHIGAGKLGIGLLLPAMVVSEIPFSILQKPSARWSPVLNSKQKQISIIINEHHICELTLIRNLEELQATGYLQQSNGTKLSSGKTNYRLHPPVAHSPDVANCRLLILDSSLHHILLLSSDSFSCALGPGMKDMVIELAKALPANSGLDRPALYACENDHKAVDSIRDLLDYPLFVKECMVDRICSDQRISETSIKVTAEPYDGEIVITARFPLAISVAFGGPNVLKPTTAGAYSYLYQRKFLLVNGTHTTLAFMTLREFCRNPEEAPGDYELISPDEASMEVQEELRAWSTARCLVLLHSHEIDVIKFAQQATSNNEVVDALWRYAERTVKRFATVRDSTKRVLGGGVVNRYETRLKDVLETLDTFDRSVPLGHQMLIKARFESMAHLKAILRKLVHDAEVFVHPEESQVQRQAGYLQGYQLQLSA